MSRRVRRGIVVLAAAGSLLAFLPATAGATAAQWLPDPVPSPTRGTGELTKVSCTSTTSCLAVGSYVNAVGREHAHSATWNGSSWQTHPTPTPNGTTDVVLADVSCATDSCVAVGNYGDDSVAFAELWNGASWRITRLPTTARSVRSVACGAPTMCVAVGYAGSQAAAFVWNGARWSRSTIAHPGADAGFADVDCPTASDCIAVGYRQGGQFAERYEDGTWKRLPDPHAGLAAISCSAVDACTVVGATQSWDTAVQTWNGTAWQVAGSPDVPGASRNELEDVSCTSASSCTAVGTAAGIGYPEHPQSHDIAFALAENDGVWSLSSVPRSHARVADLRGISCPSATDCLAVGLTAVDEVVYVPPSTLTATLHAGHWRLRPGPDRRGTTTAALTDLACTSATDCLAVGWQRDASGKQHALAEQRTSAGWRLLDVPVAVAPSQLTGISCVAADDCVAVGSAGPHEQPLALKWDGSAWTDLHAVPGKHTGRLTAVSCPAADRCVAVGSPTQTWDGTSWHEIDPPTPPNSYGTFLDGVSCVSATSCVAAGSVLKSSEFGLVSYTIELDWDGTSWTMEPDGTEGTLDDVFCSGPTACMATGVDNDGRLLIEQRTASGWAVVPAPSPAGLGSTELAAVSCSSADYCVAAGYASGTVAGAKYAGATLIESWNGTAWRLQSATNTTGETSPAYAGVSCAGAVCRTVGNSGTPWPVPIAATNG